MPGRGHNQALFPNYERFNTISSGSVSTSLFYTNPPTSSVIQANVDWYDYAPSFTGAAGVGTGVFASRPATCTTGVGYWATDQNKLYTCVSTNTWGLGLHTLHVPEPPTGAPTDCDYKADEHRRAIPRHGHDV